VLAVDIRGLGRGHLLERLERALEGARHRSPHDRTARVITVPRRGPDVRDRVAQRALGPRVGAYRRELIPPRHFVTIMVPLVTVGPAVA
jgi:hypothetical protein